MPSSSCFAQLILLPAREQGRGREEEGEGGGRGGEGEAGRVKRVIALPLCTHRNYIIVFIVQAHSNSTLTT